MERIKENNTIPKEKIKSDREKKENATAIKIWKLVRATISNWWEMEPFRQSAIIAYYAIFSLPALLVIIITVAGFTFGTEVIDGKIYDQIKNTMGLETADQIKVMLVKATESKTSVWATIIGIFTVLLGSIGVFVELQKTLNMIWKVEAAPGKGIWRFLRNRLFSFGLILSIAFLLMISLIISIVLAAASDFLKADSSKLLLVFFQILNLIISLGVISFLFALMFKFLPDAKISWRQVWVGALLTGILFTIGKTALSFYFGKADPGSEYGAAGSIVLILLWTSYSSMILFLGAEFTHTYADMYSGGLTASATGKKI
ncbi:MAG: YihY/virulence factor BrkB family protein [Saprospiraceae bacterium]|nr:YihY/virulence factor BrkB family protein [Saprospiraceae bacterium]